EVNKEVTLPEKEVEVEAHKREGKSLEKEITKKQKMDEEEKELRSHLQIVFNDDDDVYTESTPLASKIPIVDYKIHLERNKPYFKIIKADDDFLLNILKIMFEKPNIEASVWRDQKGRYGLAKVKSWKLSKSCGVHIITFTTTQMFLLVERNTL
nr:hypothetical protein [Tanacetum cinerariifolium]